MWCRLARSNTNGTMDINKRPLSYVQVRYCEHKKCRPASDCCGSNETTRCVTGRPNIAPGILLS